MTRFDSLGNCRHCGIEKELHRYNCVRAQFDKDLREGNLGKGFSCMFCGQELEHVTNDLFLCRNKECTHYSFRKAMYGEARAK